MRFWRSVLRNQRIRVAVYVLVILGLFVIRGPQWWKAAVATRADPTAAHLVVAGADLAPSMVEALLASYRRDYPQARVEVQGRGTTHALQALVDGSAGAALLARPPLATEQAHFEARDGAPLLYEPIAVAGLALLCTADAALDSLTTTALRTWLSTATPDGFDRFYAEDPNLGLWEALLSSLDLPLDLAVDRERVVFVHDRAELVRALRDDPRAIGLMSSVFLPLDRAPARLKALAVRTEDDAAALPTHEAVGQGFYPLVHSLYVACRASARGEPAKFLTFASGARGQRIIERAGFLPARQFLREILLDGSSVGAR